MYMWELDNRIDIQNSVTLLKGFFVTQDGSSLLIDNKLFPNGSILGRRRIV